MSDFPVLVLGAGGHGRVVASVLLLTSCRVTGYLDADPSSWGNRLLDLPVIGGDDRLAEFPADTIRLANGIGSIADTGLRRKIFDTQKKKGYTFETIVHPGACVSPFAELGEGVQIMAGAVVQPGAKIGGNVIVNTGAIVDHDCIIGEHTHVAPGATLSGGARIGSNCHIGTGAVLIQGVELGENCVIGAGAVVIRHHASGSRLVGVPAREIGKQ